MSRNGSGVYSLPAGNPVVTGTTISSSWANTTLSDIATALTGSVASDGQTAMTGNLQMGNNKVTGLAVATTSGDALSYAQAATISTLTVTGNASVGGTFTLTGGLTLNGNVTVGDSSADTLTINSTVTSHLLFTDNTYDIGASGATRPRDLYLAGNEVIGGTLGVTGATTLTGAFAANGGATLGDASGDALTINSSAVSIPNGLNFDSNTFVIDATNDRVGVGTTSPSYKLEVAVSNPTRGIISRIRNTAVSSQTGSQLEFLQDNVDYWSVGQPAGVSAFAFWAGRTSSADGTEIMRLTSTGNVGIGTSSPSARLEISTGGATKARITSTIDNNADLDFYTNGVYRGLIEGNSVGMLFGTVGALPNLFITNNTERMRITSGGYLLVGATSTPNQHRIVGSASGLWALVVQNNISSNPFGQVIQYENAAPNGTGNAFLYCGDSVTVRAEIRSNGGIANYSANNVNLSDARTKTDIVDAGGYLDKICAIPVRTFKYKDQTDNELNLGVIAQEVEAVAPELVDVSGFGETPEDGVPLKAIYQTDLVYALMKSIQELKAEVDSLKAQLNKG